MDAAGDVTLSTDPGPRGSVPARDHWRQAACVFVHPQAVRAGAALPLRVGHDPDMPWMAPSEPVPDARVVQPPVHLPAGLHFAQAAANMAAWRSVLAALGAEAQHTVCVGDGPVLSRLLPGAPQLTYSRACTAASLADHPACTVLEPELAPGNGLPCFPGSAVAEAVEMHDARWLVAEPFFYNMRAPGAKAWLLGELLRFWRAADCARATRPGLQIAPNACTVYAQAVSCPHFYHTRQPIDVVEDVQLAAFNSAAARPNSLAVMDLGPWADDVQPLGQPAPLATWQYGRTDLTAAAATTVLRCGSSPCHAVVLTCTVRHNDIDVADCGSRQAVFVLPPALTAATSISVRVSLAPASSPPATLWDAMRDGVAVNVRVDDADNDRTASLSWSSSAP